MSDPSETETDQAETDQGDQGEREAVKGVDLDPGGKTAIAVDTQERLDHKDEEPDFDELPDDELEDERQKRLDPDNRPDNVEVDNSKRDFNPETGLFEDSEMEPPEEAPFATIEGETSKESEDTEPTDADESKEAKESKDTES